MIAARDYAAFALACLAALAACGDIADATAQSPIQVMPLPAKTTTKPGAFQLTDGMRILATDPRAAPIAAYLADLISRSRGVSVHTGRGPVAADQ